MDIDIKEKIKPSIPPGFMELLPREQIAFNSMLKTIQECYEMFGFVPLDTPVIEKAEVLLAKGGEEAQKQTYTLRKGANDLALRFDLTVPLARYVSEHFNNLIFPFKRYQIGKVYRGEKPQKGRFREFYHCDIDIIGKGTLDLVNDAEILGVINFTFDRLKLGRFQIRLNNRKILVGFSEELGLKDKSTDALRIIDKLEKIGGEKLSDEFKSLGLDDKQIDKIFQLFEIDGSTEKILDNLENLKIENKTFAEGLLELKEVVKYINYLKIPESNWKIDLTIARGLDYYTGTVYETYLTDYPQLVSVCSGGRYDNLAEYYTDKKLPGVGTSLGLTRLFYQLNEMNLIDKASSTPTKLLLISLTESLKEVFVIADNTRSKSIPTEVYTGYEKDIRRKMDYANKTGVTFVGLVGEKEIKEKTITIKNMKTGEQKTMPQDQLSSEVIS